MDGLGLLAVELGDDALDIEDDLGHVLLHTRNGGKLMLDTGDLDGVTAVPGREDNRIRRRELPRVVP